MNQIKKIDEKFTTVSKVSIEELFHVLQSDEKQKIDEQKFTGSVYYYDSSGVEKHLDDFAMVSAWGIIERFTHEGISVKFIEKNGKKSIVAKDLVTLPAGYKVLTISNEINNRISSLV